jgi:hypothetical protein
LLVASPPLSPLQDLQFTPCFLLPGDDHQGQGEAGDPDRYLA